MEALVRGVTVYMVVIEGTLALTGARFLLRTIKDRGWLPGFQDGFTHVNRDESRHVGFGVKFLADAIKAGRALQAGRPDHARGDDPGRRSRVLARPWLENRYDFDTPFGYRSTDIFEYAMKSLSKKLAAMGMEPIAAPTPA